MRHRSALSPLVALLVGGLITAAPGPAGSETTAGDDLLEIESIQVSFTDVAVDGGGARRLAEAIELPNRPEMLAIDTGGVAATFSLRSQGSDGVWSDWLEVGADAEEGPDGAAGTEGGNHPIGAIGPIWLGDDARSIEISQLSGDRSEVTLEAINSTDTRAESNALPRSALLGTDRPTITPRSAWATNGWRSENSGCQDGPYIADNVRTVVVHHTVTTNNYEQHQVDDILRAIYRLHADTNGWCDIAYNFVVDRFGTIWEARSGGADKPVIGGHAKGFNTWTVGVALLGQHQSGASPTAAPPSAESIAAVESLAAWKLARHGIDPLGSSWLKNRSSRPPHRFPENEFVQLPTIVGHRDLGVTSCPGSLTVPSIAPMRVTLAAAHNAAPPPLPAGRNTMPGPELMAVDAKGGLRAAVAASPTVSPSVGNTGVIAIAGNGGGGQLLLANGSLAAFGTASSTAVVPAGARRAVDISIGANADQGWVLEEDGRIYHFGGTSDRTAPVKPAVGQAIALGLLANGRGYVLDASGGLFAVDGAPSRSIARTVNAVDIALRSDGVSGWVLAANGQLHAFGGAPDWQPELPVVNARAIVTGGDYGGWVLDAEGRLIRFGDERRANPISTTVGQNDIIDVAILGWDYGAETDRVRLATAFLQLFLRQTPSAELADHYGFLLDERSVHEVVIELSQSEAWAGALIDELYVDVLGRSGDAAGQAYWLGLIRNGLRTQDLGALFYGSQEYVTSSGSTGAYVARLYAELLEREPDGPGAAFWVSQLESGRMSPPEVTIGFYQSPESRNRRVVRLYEEVLNRGPDPAGLAYWSGQLLEIDDIALAQELATSKEFRDRVLR